MLGERGRIKQREGEGELEKGERETHREEGIDSNRDIRIRYIHI